MKKVLITGINSYVGNSFTEWVNNNEYDIEIVRISVRNDKWREIDLSIYDAILHVAGIAHVSTDPKMEELYYKVNRDLTIDIAKKAKLEKVRQFIFISSIIVYGDKIENNGVITKHTTPKPSTFYGKSKLQAEEGILTLQDDTFNVAIIRPPMIYGRNSKGNYAKLAKLSRKTPLFPNYKNKRSMIHIDNFSEFLRLMVNNNESGIFYPQNRDYVKTSEMVRVIAEVQGKNILMTKIANLFISLLVERINIINKMFGNLVYDKELSFYKDEYQVRNFKESIIATELESPKK